MNKAEVQTFFETHKNDNIQYKIIVTTSSIYSFDNSTYYVKLPRDSRSR